MKESRGRSKINYENGRENIRERETENQKEQKNKVEKAEKKYKRRIRKISQASCKKHPDDVKYL